MKYAAEMDSGAMMYEYMPSFIKKLIGWDTQTHRHTDSMQTA
jgi:hypothetical protein